MLNNLFLPILTGVLTLMLIISLICLFDDIYEFLTILIFLPLLWLLGKVVLLFLVYLF